MLQSSPGRNGDAKQPRSALKGTGVIDPQQSQEQIRAKILDAERSVTRLPTSDATTAVVVHALSAPSA